MTERDKAAIERMRRRGLSYQEIAGNLAISKDAVRSYCRTHDIAPDTDIRQDTGVGFRERKEKKVLLRWLPHGMVEKPSVREGT